MMPNAILIYDRWFCGIRQLGLHYLRLKTSELD